MAEAAASAQKEPTGRFTRDAVDDESFLAELYTLIGDGAHSAAPRTSDPQAQDPGGAQRGAASKRP